MIRKYLLPLLAVAGFSFAVMTAVKGGKAVVPAPPVAAPSQPPFQSFVAGAGLIEANTENIAIGTHVAGIVSDISVQLGGKVKTGDPLFKIDDRELQAMLPVRRAAVEAAKARIDEAVSQVGTAKKLLGLATALDDKRSISVEEMSRRTSGVTVAEARLAAAQADLASAEAELKQTEMQIELRTVRAPVDGEILQLKIHRGEFAPAGALAQPLILLGGTDPLVVRVDVDENDAWRVTAGAAAVAFVRGNKDLKTDLKFARFEPYVIPKHSLTGDTTERVDTRVLQILYSFQRAKMPVYVGQQMDVFIEADSRERTEGGQR